VAEGIGKQEDAYKAYEKALQKKPDLAEALLAQGSSLVLARRQAEGAREARGGAEDASRDAREEEAAATWPSTSRTGRPARSGYQRALQLDPEDPQAHSVWGARSPPGRLAGCAGRVGSRAAAGRYRPGAPLRVRLAPAPHRGFARGALGGAARGAARFEGPPLPLPPGRAPVERREYEKAETELRQARLGSDRYGETWFNLARALAGQGKLGEAIDTMRRAVELEPVNPNTSTSRG